MPKTKGAAKFELENVEREEDAGDTENLRFLTNDGNFVGRLHRSENGSAAILWVFGAGGGLGGPAGGVYERLAGRFQSLNITSLQLDYRRPGYLKNCVEDVLLGIGYLKSLGKSRIVLVGHSFGGAVVISAGVVSNQVIAVAALSSQTVGADNVGLLNPKPLLLVHGADDEILPATCSIYLFQKAEEPKRIILYEDSRHGLDGCREELDRDLTKWLGEVLEIKAKNNT